MSVGVILLMDDVHPRSRRKKGMILDVRPFRREGYGRKVKPPIFAIIEITDRSYEEMLNFKEQNYREYEPAGVTETDKNSPRRIRRYLKARFFCDTAKFSRETRESLSTNVITRIRYSDFVRAVADLKDDATIGDVRRGIH